jgi:CheY-like chemotaxis protein
LIETSIAAGKIMQRQLTSVFSDMNVPFSLSVAVSGADALDKCDGQYTIDLVIVNSVLSDEMMTNELIEFLRNQPKTENSFIIILSKSALNNTSELIASGADLIWPKPLPEKNELIKRLKRICSVKV